MRPRTPTEALAFFASRSPSTIKLGLERMHEALERLGHPERRFRSLHVAGTNGKGSTCAFADAGLRAQGHRVGLYTSPHLIRPNERIRVGGEEISDEAFGARILEVVERLPELCDDASGFTYFELGTLVALWHFAQERVDVAVLETGLGGRLDATTAVVPEVTAVTAISFDHMDYLGHTLDAIAREKAGIFKPGVPALIAAQPPEALSALDEVARKVGAPALHEGADFEGTFAADGTFRYRGRGAFEGVRLSLRGEHQRHNAALAAACLEALDGRGLKVSTESIRTGLETARWPGRLEEIPGTPTLLLDGAHNPDGVRTLVSALETLYAGRRVHLVFGVLADKDHGPMRAALFPHCASVHLCPVPSPRTLEPAGSLDDARKLVPDVRVSSSVEQAIEGACSLARGDDLVLCAGSLVLVGAAERWVTESGRAGRPVSGLV